MSSPSGLGQDPSEKPLLDEKHIGGVISSGGSNNTVPSHNGNNRSSIISNNNKNGNNSCVVSTHYPQGGPNSAPTPHTPSPFSPTCSYAGLSSGSCQYKSGSGSCPAAMSLHKCQELENRIRQQQCWFKIALLIITIGFTIIIIAVPVLFTKLSHDLTHHTHKPKVGELVAAILHQEALCVPCDDFRLGPSPEEERMLHKFSLQDTDAGLSCCVDTPQELMELMKMFVERRFRQEMAKGTINPWPRSSSSSSGPDTINPAAHLMMASQKLDDISQILGRQYQIGDWIHDRDLAFTQRTTYRHGRIVIPEDGLYFVYSQISFMEYYNVHHSDGHGSRGGTESPSLSHYLYRYNINYHSGGEEKMAQNSITKCWGQSRQYGEYTSYLGAVFYLRNSDEIFVKVSNITMVDTDPKLSYFGLYKI